MSAIHVSKDELAGGYEVWLDCEEDTVHDGLCIGLGSSRIEALNDAEHELFVAMKDIRDLREEKP